MQLLVPRHGITSMGASAAGAPDRVRGAELSPATPSSDRLPTTAQVALKVNAIAGPLVLERTLADNLRRARLHPRRASRCRRRATRDARQAGCRACFPARAVAVLVADLVAAQDDEQERRLRLLLLDGRSSLRCLASMGARCPLGRRMKVKGAGLFGRSLRKFRVGAGDDELKRRVWDRCLAALLAALTA